MLNFQEIALAAQSNINSLLTSWLPGGVFRGGEYVVRNPKRDDKKAGSFRININTGEWADFAIAGCAGGDGHRRLANRECERRRPDRD